LLSSLDRTEIRGLLDEFRSDWASEHRAYSPHEPNAKQQAFLALECREALYGGAAGGGKSDALLMAALQHVHVPGYRALLLRRTYSDLALPGALLDRARDWFTGKAKWSRDEKTWSFPGGGSITFGYLENENDKYRYQGAEFQFIGFDELTQFTETQYRYLFSRIRRLQGSLVPLRMRAGSNPGGVGHDWVKARWNLSAADMAGGVQFNDERAFVPARLDDNTALDAREYEAALSELDPLTRQQLLAGDWQASAAEGFFRREWFKIIPASQVPAGLKWVRFWDCASKVKERSDFWAGAKMAKATDGRYFIGHMIRHKWEYADGRAAVLQTAMMDTPACSVGVEDTSSGTAVVSDLRRDPKASGFTVTPVPVTQDKATRAGPWASRAAGGLIYLAEGAWVPDFLDEVERFPADGAHDDQVDAVSGAYHLLTRPREIRVR
jgi:predicted phage terminase large subunit-like protein